MRPFLLPALILSLNSLTGWAQDAARPDPKVDAPLPGPTGSSLPSAYALGPGDQISIAAVDAEEISGKPVLIGINGNIDLPMVGRVHVAGLTVEQVQEVLTARLRTYIIDPQVSVNVTELRSQPVSIIGAVTNPGVHQLAGHKTLVEMLSLAGGLRSEAGYSVKITRKAEWGPIPLPTAKPDSTGEFSIAEVEVQNIMNAKNPEQNIAIMPNDIISVPKADMIYVIGDVMKTGSIILGDQKTTSVLQAISMAGGLGRTAKSRNVKILRLVPGSASRTELPVDLKAILASKTGDITMYPEDILFVPTSNAKTVALQTLQAAMGTGLATIIYRIP